MLVAKRNTVALLILLICGVGGFTLPVFVRIPYSASLYKLVTREKQSLTLLQSHGSPLFELFGSYLTNNEDIHKKKSHSDSKRDLLDLESMEQKLEAIEKRLKSSARDIAVAELEREALLKEIKDAGFVNFKGGPNEAEHAGMKKSASLFLEKSDSLADMNTFAPILEESQNAASIGETGKQKTLKVFDTQHSDSILDLSTMVGQASAFGGFVLAAVGVRAGLLNREERQKEAHNIGDVETFVDDVEALLREVDNQLEGNAMVHAKLGGDAEQDTSGIDVQVEVGLYNRTSKNALEDEFAIGNGMETNTIKHEVDEVSSKQQPQTTGIEQLSTEIESKENDGASSMTNNTTEIDEQDLIIIDPKLKVKEKKMDQHLSSGDDEVVVEIKEMDEQDPKFKVEEKKLDQHLSSGDDEVVVETKEMDEPDPKFKVEEKKLDQHLSSGDDEVVVEIKEMDESDPKFKAEEKKLEQHLSSGDDDVEVETKEMDELDPKLKVEEEKIEQHLSSRDDDVEVETKEMDEPDPKLYVEEVKKEQHLSSRDDDVEVETKEMDEPDPTLKVEEEKIKQHLSSRDDDVEVKTTEIQSSIKTASEDALLTESLEIEDDSIEQYGAGFEEIKELEEENNIVEAFITDIEDEENAVISGGKMFDAKNCVIKVLGIGDGGIYALDCMMQASDLEFWAIDTNAATIQHSMTKRNALIIGCSTTNGAGAMGNPEVGKIAAEESIDDISRVIDGSDVCLVLCGAGAGTGGGSAPVISNASKESDALTIAIVTKPFSFEGKKRARQADESIGRLRSTADTVIVISNENVLRIIPDDISLEDSFRVVDDLMKQLVFGVSNIIRKAGISGESFKALFKNSGICTVGIGTAMGSGTVAAEEATLAALESPLLDTPVEEANYVLVNVCGGSNLSEEEIVAVRGTIEENLKLKSELVMASRSDISFDGLVSVTLIACIP